MIIRGSTVALAGAWRYQVDYSRTERLRAWSGPPSGAVPSAPRRPSAATPPTVAAQPATQAPASPATQPTGGTGEAKPTAAARYAVLIALVERLTGQKVHVLDESDFAAAGTAPVGGPATSAAPASAAPPARQGWGIDYQMTEVRQETQHTTFVATGRVTTTDGREITFAAQATFDRSSRSVTEVRVRAGDAAMTDPLVLNFGTGPAGITPSTVDFDLNSDGKLEHMPFVATGNGLLVLDVNGNGQADNGSELFGPSTGDGFAELARYDADGNSWIDGADPVYGQLRIWNQADGQLLTLAEAGVGAIGLARVSTPFQFDTGGQAAGQLRASGVWLSENGSAGTVHQIDLRT